MRSSLIFLLAVLQQVCGKEEDKDWKQVSCSHFPKERIFNCSYLNLQTIPRIPPNTTYVDLSNNNISSILPTYPLPNGVLYLNVSHNQLTALDDADLKQWSNLVSLDLSHNGIDLNTVPKDLFLSLRNLDTLNIKRNAHRLTSERIDCEVALMPTSLTHLKMNGWKCMRFGKAYRKLVKLTHLDISGKKKKKKSANPCNLGVLDSNFLENLSSVKHLDVSFCNITVIQPHALAHLKDLHKLDISGNPLTFSVFQNITKDLLVSNIKVLRANLINCESGPGTVLFGYPPWKNSTIRELYLDSNRIEVFYNPIIPNNLKVLSLRDNRLLYEYALEIILSSANIVTLDLSFQFNNEAPDPDATCQLIQHCTNSGIITKPPFSYEESHSPWQLKMPTALDTIFLNDNNFKGPLDDLYNQKFTTSLKRIHLQRNVLYEWTGNFTYLGQSEFLDLSDNFCSKVADHFFHAFPKLTTLIISNNSLGMNINSESNAAIFMKQKNLIRLDMSNNHISSLPRTIFEPLRRIETLNISRNKLADFDVSLSNLRTLKTLDLSCNVISTLPKSVVDDIDVLLKLHNRTGIEIDLSNNSLRCTCEESSLYFIQWMLSVKAAQVRFRGFDSYHCVDSMKRTVRVKGMRLDKLNKECASYVILIFSLVAMITLFMVITTFGILHRYRWKLRYMYYMTKAKHRNGSNDKAGTTNMSQYRYDAFVSFADDQYTFVKEELIKNLEENGNFRVCLHSRDFTPGKDIAENITEAVHTSRVTVCLITEAYLKSYWCMYEFHISRMESVYSRSGENVQFLVVMETIRPHELPLQLMEVIERKSYIEYPNDPQGNIVFWMKMKEVLENT